MFKRLKKTFSISLLLLTAAIYMNGCSDNGVGNGTEQIKYGSGSVPCKVPVTIFTQYQETPVGWDPYIDVGADVTVKRPDGTVIFQGVVPEDGYLYTSIACNAPTGWYNVIAKKVVDNQIIHYGSSHFIYTGMESNFFVRIITLPY